MCSGTFLKRISEEDGFAMIEAALVYPLLVLIVFSVMFAGLRLQAEMKESAAEHRTSASREESLLREETLLRTVWLTQREGETP